MPHVEETYLNEDLNKPENRINVAVFGLMQQDWFRRWLLNQLKLPSDAVIYPPKNAKEGRRPDLTAEAPNGSTLAWIEVEVGTNPSQADDYREIFSSDPVKTIWGERGGGGDLSLEEIAEYLSGWLDEPLTLAPQTRINTQHLHDQIRQALAGYSPASPRAGLSDEVWEREPLVKLRELLGEKLVRTTRRFPIGKLGVDTVKPQGFSLKVNKRDGKTGTLSVMSQSGGRPEVMFPSQARLKRYLPDHGEAIYCYERVLTEIGLPISKYKERQRHSLPLDIVMQGLDEIVPCLKALAD